MAVHRFVARFTMSTKEGTWERAKAIEDEEKAYILAAYESGGAIALGRFADPTQGALGIFASKEAADAFVKDDPFAREGILDSCVIHEFNEVMSAPEPAAAN